MDQDDTKAGKSQLLYSRNNLKHHGMGQSAYQRKPETADNHGRKNRNTARVVESASKSIVMSDQHSKEFAV